MSQLPQNEIMKNALRKQVKLLPNDNRWSPAVAWQTWRLPPLS
jgi:hypothetical protein